MKFSALNNGIVESRQHGVLGKWMLRRLFAIALSDKSVVLTFFSFLIVSLARIQTNLPPLTNERKLLDERKKTSRSFFIFSWRVSYPSNDCTLIKKSRQQREECCRERLGIILNNYSTGYELIYLPILTFSNGFLFISHLVITTIPRKEALDSSRFSITQTSYKGSHLFTLNIVVSTIQIYQFCILGNIQFGELIARAIKSFQELNLAKIQFSYSIIIKENYIAHSFNSNCLTYKFICLCPHKEKETKKKAPAAAPELKNRAFP